MMCALIEVARHIGNEELPPTNQWRLEILTGWFVVCFGFVGVIVWSAIAPLDKGVFAPGELVVIGHKQTVQNPNEGIIRRILVAEGDVVAKDQVVMQMEPLALLNLAAGERAQYAFALLTHDRLVAELEGRADAPFPLALADLQSNEEVQAQWLTERELLTSRTRAFRSGVAAMRASVSGLRMQVLDLEDSRASRQKEKALVQQHLERVLSLANRGFVARNAIDDPQLRLARLDTERAENEALLQSVQGRIAELESKILQREYEHQQELQSFLVEAKREIQRIHSRLKAIELDIRHSEIRAPASGKVLGLTVFTEGAVVGAGTILMHVVPQDKRLEVQARVPIDLVDQVEVGMSVSLTFTSLQRTTSPRLDGVVQTIGADRSIEQRTGAPYFSVEVALTEESQRALRIERLRTGMAADVFIKTGERTLLNYITKPLTDRMRAALHEE